MVLISLSKHRRKYCISKLSLLYCHSAFIISQSLLFLWTWWWKDTWLVEHSANPYVHMLTKPKLTSSCATASVEHCLSKIVVLQNIPTILAKSLRRKTIELQLLRWFHIVMYNSKSDLIDSAPQMQLCSWLSASILLLEINIGLFALQTTSSTAQF